ncbi:MAG: DNA-processing protein DprA [Bacillota bacterium]
MAARELLALAGIPGIGARRVAWIRERFVSVEAALRAKPGLLSEAARLGRGGETLFKTANWSARLAEAESELARLRAFGGWALGVDEPGYPELLRSISDPPPVLFGLGDPGCLGGTLVAVVGTRRATPYGLAAARLLAGDLARSGLVTVSGLAYGIDGEAHRAALAAGGITIAVLGSGLRHVYPMENRPLAERITRAGAVVSEHTLDTEPRPGHFPARNRIISGLSKGVVVVESDERGGAMITADCALEQGREVMAVPGPITSRFSRGPNALIKQGATVVTEAGDIGEAIGWGDGGQCGAATPRPPRDLRRLLGPAAELVYRSLTGLPAGPDEIIQATNLDPSAVAAALGALEVEGLIRRTPGPSYMRLTED